MNLLANPQGDFCLFFGFFCSLTHQRSPKLPLGERKNFSNLRQIWHKCSLNYSKQTLNWGQVATFTSSLTRGQQCCQIKVSKSEDSYYGIIAYNTIQYNTIGSGIDWGFDKNEAINYIYILGNKIEVHTLFVMKKTSYLCIAYLIGHLVTSGGSPS